MQVKVSVAPYFGKECHAITSKARAVAQIADHSWTMLLATVLKGKHAVVNPT